MGPPAKTLPRGSVVFSFIYVGLRQEESASGSRTPLFCWMRFLAAAWSLLPYSASTCQQCWGRLWGVHPLSLLMWLRGVSRVSSLLLMPKEIPHPTPGSPAPCFLKHFDHFSWPLHIYLMLRFFFLRKKKNLFDLNGCEEVKQAECPPIFRG